MAVEIVPQIITQNGGSLARDILRVKIEEKGTSRRTVYRRIDEAEQTGLIKFCKAGAAGTAQRLSGQNGVVYVSNPFISQACAARSDERFGMARSSE